MNEWGMSIITKNFPGGDVVVRKVEMEIIKEKRKNVPLSL